mgnify:CR=1 FL=1
MTSKQLGFRSLLGAGAIGSPMVAAFVVQQLPSDSPRLEIFSVGILAGLLVGQLIGLRRGGLAALILCPAMGFLAGFVDLKAFQLACLYVAITTAALLPFWGLMIGVAAAWSRRHWRRGLVIVAVITAIDFASRYAWHCGFEWESWTGFLASSSKRWLLESLVYSPTALTATMLAIPRDA